MQDAEACFMIADRCFMDRTAAVSLIRFSIDIDVFSMDFNHACRINSR